LRGGGEELHVPWVGFKGDYQWIKVLTDASCGLPVVFQVRSGATDCVGGGVQRVGSGGTTFTMQGSDFPIVLYHLNSTTTAFFEFDWNATRA
jgi:hypothetical protein